MSTEQKTTRQCVCKHLRSKEMFHSDKPLELDQFHSGIFWCEKTHDGRGPDGVFADMEECSAARECFEQ